MKRVVQRFGGSLVITIPAEIARRLRINEGDSLDVEEEGGEIVVRPRRSVSDVMADWEDLAPEASEADLARAVIEERSARTAYLENRGGGR